MPKIKLESLREGMVVTTDVKNMDNMLLIPAGGVLTERHINILQAWGILEVQVEAAGEAEDSSDPVQTLTPEAREKLIQDLKSIFWEPIDKNPVQAEAFALALRRQASHPPGGPSLSPCR
jgi:hypothetical protein